MPIMNGLELLGEMLCGRGVHLALQWMHECGLLGVWLQRVLPATIDDLAASGTARGTKRALGVQRWLHAWLLVHVPLAMGLLVLVAVHAIVALRY